MSCKWNMHEAEINLRYWIDFKYQMLFGGLCVDNCTKSRVADTFSYTYVTKLI